MGPKAPGPWKTLYGNDLAKAPAGTLKQDNFDKTHFRKMWHIPPEPINPGMKTIKKEKNTNNTPRIFSHDDHVPKP
jgi:hypothetical protein